MRRIGIFIVILLLATQAMAAIVYLDKDCPTPGDASGSNDYSSTCDGTAADNPTTTFSQALGVIASAGDILRVRGVHSSHGSCPGSDGRYGADIIQVTENGSAGNPIIFEANGWTAVGAGTEEAVYIEGTAAPGSGVNLGWTACSDCGAGSAVVACRNVPGTCGDVWWTAKTAADNPGNQILMLWAQRPDGSMTFRENKNTCSGATLDNQYDSCSPETDGGVLAVRWGASTPNSTNKPYVVYDNNGFGFFLNGSTYITIRGFNFRAFRSIPIIFVGVTNNIVISDNTFAYVSSTNGFDHAVSSDSPGNATNITIRDNEMSYIGSEAVHTQALVAGATVYTIQRNYIHDLGDLTVMGPGAGLANTPTGLILGDYSGGASNGDYTDSVVEDNLIVNTGIGSSPGACVSFENVSSNWKMRNNICSDISGECIRFEAGGGAGGAGITGNLVYNNLLHECGQNKGSGTGAGIYFNATANQPVSSNSVYNNTIVNGAEIGIDSAEGAVTLDANLIRNNIIVSAVSKKCVKWTTTDADNHLNNNLCNTAANPAITWLNTGYACADLDTIETGNKECVDPLFAGAADFHIQTTSPAKDSGTTSLAARTADICNSIAAAHGFANYADCFSVVDTPDIGMDELTSSPARRRTLLKVGGKHDSP